MTKELKLEWAKALRSGKYKQGRGALLKDGKYCCLGVLCEMKGLEAKENDYGGMGFESFNGRIWTGFLPRGFREFIGIDGSGYSKDLDESLSSLNDNGYTFDEIADLLELSAYGAFKFDGE